MVRGVFRRLDAIGSGDPMRTEHGDAREVWAVQGLELRGADCYQETPAGPCAVVWAGRDDEVRIGGRKWLMGMGGAVATSALVAAISAAVCGAA